ncbi:MAG: rhodanese-like domain-containing protein [candidate division NC10 bacterium]
MPRQQSGEPFERIDVAEGKDLLEKHRVKWIDVREPAEWEQGHIPGARLVPLNNLLLSPRQYLTGDGAVFYCAQGIRSAVACDMAAAVGLTDIYNLEGGIQEWISRGFPVILA